MGDALLHSAPVGQLTLQHAHMAVGHVWESGKPEQGGMPPTRQNTTRRNAAKQTNQNRQANIYNAECRRTNQPKQGGMPPTRENTTRRNAANKTKHNKAECRQTDKPKQTSEHLQGGMPPNKPTKTRRNAANKTKHNKAECRQQDKTQQGGMPPNAFFMCFVAANLRGLATEDCWQGFVSQPPRANPNGSRLPHLP